MARVHLHPLGYFYINESRALIATRGMTPDLICPLCGMPLHKYCGKLSPVTYHHINPLAEEKTNGRSETILLTEPHQCMLHFTKPQTHLDREKRRATNKKRQATRMTPDKNKK